MTYISLHPIIKNWKKKKKKSFQLLLPDLPMTSTASRKSSSSSWVLVMSLPLYWLSALSPSSPVLDGESLSSALFSLSLSHKVVDLDSPMVLSPLQATGPRPYPLKHIKYIWTFVVISLIKKFSLSINSHPHFETPILNHQQTHVFPWFLFFKTW